MTQRRGSYGIDAPLVPAMLALGALPLILGAIGQAAQGNLGGAAGMGLAAVFMLGCSGSFLYTTRRGKFAVWESLLDGLALRGDEQVLDMGCGRGLVLLAAAARLPRGRATGVDIWQAKDQSGNAMAATLGNATLEGVAKRVELHTADMQKLPFPDATFDVVLSSLAIHNIAGPEGRRAAVHEAARVLKHGGRLLVADFKHTQQYAAELERCGLAEVAVRGLGPRFWYGGPWAATSAVTGRKV